MDLQSREKAITRTSIIGIIANLLLVAFKMLAGLLSGSIAIILDAVNNLADALSSVITILGIKLAKRRPDNKHPYGYGRVEYFSTILIALLVTYAGATSIVESVKKIAVPEMPDFTPGTIIIVVASIIVKLLLGRFVSAQGKRYNSDALTAAGKEASLDSVISVATLAGAIVALLFQVSIDGILGAVIALLIIKAGVETLLDAVSDVMGNRADSEITRSIKKDVAALPGVIGAYDLVLHNYGPDAAIGSIHVEIPGDWSAAKIHALTMQIQEMIGEKYHIAMTVGIYAVDTDDEEKIHMRETIRALCKTCHGALNAHGIYINKETKHITMDVLVDFSVADKAAFCRQIASLIGETFPGYTASIKLDTNYSD